MLTVNPVKTVGTDRVLTAVTVSRPSTLLTNTETVITCRWVIIGIQERVPLTFGETLLNGAGCAHASSAATYSGLTTEVIPIEVVDTELIHISIEELGFLDVSCADDFIFCAEVFVVGCMVREDAFKGFAIDQVGEASELND